MNNNIIYTYMSYNYIVNPVTGRKVNVFGKIGQNVLHTYLQVGGGWCSKYRKTINPKCKDQSGCHWVVGKGCKGESKGEELSRATERKYNPDNLIKTVTTKGKGTTRRLSAGEYNRKHGGPLGDRCDIRRDGEYKCLLKRRNNVAYWAAPSKTGKGQEACEDWSSRCRESDFI